MEIQTERLRLRPVGWNDAEAIFHYRSDVTKNKYQGWIPGSLDEVRDFIQNKTNLILDTPDSWFQFVIIVINENKLIGDIGVHFIGSDKTRVEIGCTLDTSFQGKGYATEALQGIIQYLFHTLEKQTIITSIDPENAASIRLVERLGFKQEAYFRKSLFLRGEWVDDVRYTLSRKDWAKEPKFSRENRT